MHRIGRFVFQRRIGETSRTFFSASHLTITTSGFPFSTTSNMRQ
jgi:hypothetical protein